MDDFLLIFECWEAEKFIHLAVNHYEYFRVYFRVEDTVVTIHFGEKRR